MPVIVLLADGARVDTVVDGMESGALPAMARLREEGGCFDITTVFPSVTGPAYTPLLMGRFPGAVGMPGLRWFDRAREACTFPDYCRSYVGYQMGAVDRDISANSPTIFELVPGSAGALSVITRGLPRERQLAALTLGASLRAARTHFRGDVSGWFRVDRDVSQRVLNRVRRGDAPFLFAAFTGVDKASHSAGHESPRVGEALRIVDDTVAALRAHLERTGEWERARLWITSDHGHSRVTHHEDLERVVAGLGHRVIAHPWVYRWRPDVAVMVSGNAMAHVYADIQSRTRPFWQGLSAAARRLADDLLTLPSVDVMLVPLDATRCEVRTRGRGSAIVTHLKGHFHYAPADGDPLGLGGPLANLSPSEAHAATVASDYPDALVQIASIAAAERSGDFILSASRDWDFRARFEPIPHASAHGALHREHMLVPLLLNRPPRTTPRRTADIMPSALAALGVGIPAGLDGESFE